MIPLQASSGETDTPKPLWWPQQSWPRLQRRLLHLGQTQQKKHRTGDKWDFPINHKGVFDEHASVLPGCPVQPASAGTGCQRPKAWPPLRGADRLNWITLVCGNDSDMGSHLRGGRTWNSVSKSQAGPADLGCCHLPLFFPSGISNVPSTASSPLISNSN